MKLFFKELFEYNHHFNQKLSALFAEKHDTMSDRSVKLFGHILNAHHIWNSRIAGKHSGLSVWDIQAVEQFRRIDDNNFNETVRILDHVDLSSIISYKTTKEQAFENKARDILFHIINHSTYHRGQIAADFRQTGTEPLTTDYIFYKR
ncbi:DinB family protein [Agriterribacter sp.]|uniref:DinB family protein n=1 Tax=Agriterribacter sp. TaxID=2821509 RepID=UPI002BC0C28C|nr:DinB family protein [Agriterribacter sp.]HRP56991.1 DinB family protein [Agriterribacter sp.]